MDINQLLIRLDDCKTGQEESDLIHDYARIQIEKDRERIKKNAKTKVLSEYEVIVDTKSIDDTPISLD